MPEEQSVVTKKVMILMPFEGEITTKNQLFKLIYQRLKYIIEDKINNDKVNPVRSRGKDCRFRVNVFLAVTGEIKDEALRTIRDSDIAIGFVCDMNVTVVYELAVRNLLRPELILIVDGETKTLLPYYLRDYAYIVPTSTWINDEFLTKLAARQSAIAVKDFDVGETPMVLTAYSDENDVDTRNSIRTALQSFVNSRYIRQNSIVKVMDDLDPGQLVSRSSSYYPTSITKYVWLPRRKDKEDHYLKYNETDKYESFICDYNYKFLELFNLNNIGKEEPLTDERIFEELNAIVDPPDLKAFIEDQTVLEQRIVYGDYNGVAKIPIRFNSNHPDERFRNRAYLPCSVLKKKIGNPDMTHYLYLLVMFYDVTDVGNYKVFHFGNQLEKTLQKED